MLVPHYIKLDQAPSTNSWLKACATMAPAGTVAHTPCQTAGRGQKGNSWESEPGKNLSFSMLLKPSHLAARDQFAISEAVSLAVADALAALVPEPADVKVKWPNDVYWRDRKICGMLIENSLTPSGFVAWSVAGPGINVNQMKFRSDAPNPVSLKQITGRNYNLDTLLHDVCNRMARLCDFDGKAPDWYARLHSHYLATLYRADGQQHLWQLPDGHQFQAVLSGVEPNGMLLLRHASDDQVRYYAFKQVKHVIGNLDL